MNLTELQRRYVNETANFFFCVGVLLGVFITAITAIAFF